MRVVRVVRNRNPFIFIRVLPISPSTRMVSKCLRDEKKSMDIAWKVSRLD